MCVILDTNSFHSVFNSESKDHADFAPLFHWIIDKQKKTSLVIGGTSYMRELGNLIKYKKIIQELARNRKITWIDNEVVDNEEKQVKCEISDRNFNDPHILGLFRASGCSLFASKDKKADPFIKCKNLYKKNQKPPKIYRSAKHKTLLTEEIIVILSNRT